MAWHLKHMRFGPINLYLYIEQEGNHALQFPRPSCCVRPHASHTAWAPNQYQSVNLSVVAIEHHGLHTVGCLVNLCVCDVAGQGSKEAYNTFE